MQVVLYPFFSCGKTKLETALRIISLATWAFGGSVYIYNVYEAFNWASVFPQPGELGIAIWMMTLSLRFLALWMPMAFLLIHWRMKSLAVLISYIAGCILAMIFSIVAVVLIQVYLKEGYLREQYFEQVNEEIKTSFPATIKAALASDNCCSWYGPTDFGALGSTFNIETKKDTDLEFMMAVADCAGKVFQVQKDAASAMLTYSPSPPEVRSAEPPRGCGPFYKSTANRLCNYITFMTVLVWIFSVVFIVLYALNYKNIKTESSVSPSPEEPVQQQESVMGGENESQKPSKDAM